MDREDGMGQQALLSGSVTVEAALLLPMIFFLILHLLYLSFFLYDQCVLMQGSYCTALRTERLWCFAEEKEAEAAEKFLSAVKTRLAGGRVEEHIEITGEGVTVEGELAVKTPGGMLFQNKWKGKQRQRADCWEPVEGIRRLRKAEQLWKDIKSGAANRRKTGE